MITHKVSKLSEELQHCRCCSCFDALAEQQKADPIEKGYDYEYGVCEDPKTCKEWTLDELILGCHVGLPIIAASSVRAGDTDIWIFHDLQPIWDDENGEYEEDDYE